MKRKVILNWRSNDSNDDFVAEYGDYMLRVEKMDKHYWWWCVYHKDDYAGFDEPRASIKKEAFRYAIKAFEDHSSLKVDGWYITEYDGRIANTEQNIAFAPFSHWYKKAVIDFFPGWIEVLEESFVSIFKSLAVFILSIFAAIFFWFFCWVKTYRKRKGHKKHIDSWSVRNSK
jgi:hypothetical protein